MRTMQRWWLIQVSHETSAKLRVFIHWRIVSEKCCMKVSRNLNRYVVMMVQK
jgi:hypothetical protein